jgi:hypothetical protein
MVRILSSNEFISFFWYETQRQRAFLHSEGEMDGKASGNDIGM